MFDLSLSKLVLIGVVALVVVGPEKLPKVARMAGSLLGRAQRYFNDVRAEVSRDMALDDLHNLRNDVRNAAQDIEASFSQIQPFSDSSSSTEKRSLDAFALKSREFRRNKDNLLSRRRRRGRTLPFRATRGLNRSFSHD